MAQQFDASQINTEFWADPAVRTALARRDIASLLRLVLERHPTCTQTRLGTLIEHDRAEISNWINGRRQGCVRDIEVLCRIAGGLQMPDTARMVLGLAPQDAPLSQFAAATLTDLNGPSGPRLSVSLCGSRNGETDRQLIDELIPGLARLVLVQQWAVTHGPVGLGIEVMTYLADRYQPPATRAAIGTLGHRNVVADADVVLAVGGGNGTAIELDLAVALGKRVIPMPRAGGATAVFASENRQTPALSWLSDNDFRALCECGPGDYPRLVQDLIAAAEGVAP